MDDKAAENFREYLKKIKSVEDDRCWLCNKSPDQIRSEYFEYMKDPDEGFEDIELDDLLIMTYKTKKPICAACYFSLKQRPDLVQEILDRPEDEIWNLEP